MMEMTEQLVAELVALKARVANLERLEKSSTFVDLTATGGLNVGTATGATEGQVLSSGAQLASAGSAAVPSHGTTGDADTGMYFPFANYLGFATGGRGLLLRAERQWIAHSNVPTLVTTYSVAGDAQNYWHVLIITTSKSTGASAFSIDIFIKCSNPIVMHTLLHSALNAAPYLALPDVHYEPTDHTIRVYQTAVANDDGATQYDIWVFATQGAITS